MKWKFFNKTNLYFKYHYPYFCMTVVIFFLGKFQPKFLMFTFTLRLTKTMTQPNSIYNTQWFDDLTDFLAIVYLCNRIPITNRIHVFMHTKSKTSSRMSNSSNHSQIVLTISTCTCDIHHFTHLFFFSTHFLFLAITSSHAIRHT